MLKLIWHFGIVTTLMTSSCFSCYIETQPRYDIIVEAGKNLVINCTFSTSCGTNSSHVHWKVTKQKGKTTTIEQFIKPIAALTAQLNISSVSVEDSGTYACWPGSSKYNSNNTNVVKVGYKPLEELSLNCTSLNLDKLTCAWSARNSSFLEETTWLLKYNSRGHWKKCVGDDPRENSCTIGEGYPTTVRTLAFFLTGNNRLGNESVHKTFKHYEIVKLNPPRSIGCTFNSRQARLTWKTPLTEAVNSNSDILINYKISYGSKWHSAEFETNGSEYTLDHLIPNTKYSIQISARLQYNSYLNGWSQPAVINFQTNQTGPEEWSALKTGSFQELHKHESQRTIVLYFKTLQLYQQNGDNFTYKIFADIDPIFTIKSYAEIPSVNLNNSYKFQVSAINNAGETTSVQSVLINNNSNSIPKPAVNDLIDFENGTYIISWNSSDTSLNYTIFWCKTENYKLDEEKNFVHCDNSGLDWIDVWCRTNFCQYHLSVNQTSQNRFAVASKTGHFSNGLVWSSCTIPTSRTHLPIIRPHVLSTASTWAKISWDLPCKDRTTTIAAFKAYYKSKETNSSEENTILHYFGENRREFTLNNLTSGTLYTLQMTAMSASGEEGERSDAVVIETPTSSTVFEESNNQPFIISITLLSILGCLCGLVFFVYKKYFKEKLQMIQNIIQHIPSGILNPSNPDKNNYSAARRDSDSKFSIQLSQPHLQSAISVDSNTSGFISDSLESVLTTPTPEDESQAQNNNETIQEEPEPQSCQCVASPYVTVIEQVQLPVNRNYIPIDSIDSSKTAQSKCAYKGYVQVAKMETSVNNNSSTNQIAPYVLVKNIIQSDTSFTAVS